MTTSQELFAEQGYLVFENALEPNELGVLRDACQSLLDEPPDDGGHSGRHRIGRGEARRFLAHRHEEFPAVESFLLSGRIGGIIEACTDSGGLLFNEQFVVKGAGKGASFAWHQDGAYVGFDHAPYLTVWIALDDATEENGCVYLIPRNLHDRPNLDPHEWREDDNELNGYSGEDQGIPMVCGAGSIVAFSSLTLHRSGPNVTDKPRRAYVCQYSPEPIRVPGTGELKRFAKPVARPRAT